MFKGGGSVELAFNRRLTRKLTVSGRHDVMQLGAGQNALTESNILSSLLSRGDSRLSMVNRGEAVYEHEWRHGISNFLGARIQKIYGNRLRPAGAPRRHGHELGSGRRRTRRDAHLEERKHLPHAVRQAVHGDEIPRPDPWVHGRDTPGAERQL